MKSLLHKAYDPSLFRKEGHRLVEQLADYLESMQSPQSAPVFKPYDPDTLFDYWQDKIRHPEKESFNSWAREVIDSSIHLHHPGYMGHQVAPVLPEAALADLLGSFLNNGVGVYEMGSPTVAMERAVIKQLAGQLGFNEEADGVLTSGGTLGNMTALLAARQVMTGTDAWEKGTWNQKYAFMVSEQAHYCIDRAVKIMGWGEDGIIKIPTDDKFQMDTSQLKAAHEAAKKRGIKVLGVVGSACSTATGSFDSLHQIADFCEQHDLWFHADAAHGGAAAYSQKYKYLISGIERADSAVVDFHKMLMCPALVTGVIFKDPSDSYQTFAQKASYLWSREDREWFNLGKRTFECTKDMMALKVYSLLFGYGPELFGEIVDTLFDLGKSFASLLDPHPGFELLIQPSSNIVCFRHLPEEMQDPNLHNREIRQRLINRGNNFIVQTEIDGKVYLRTTVMNVFTRQSHLEQLLEEIEAVAAQIPT